MNGCERYLIKDLYFSSGEERDLFFLFRKEAIEKELSLSAYMFVLQLLRSGAMITMSKRLKIGGSCSSLLLKKEDNLYPDPGRANPGRKVK